MNHDKTITIADVNSKVFKPATDENFTYNLIRFEYRMKDYFDLNFDDDPTHGVYYIDFLNDIKENYHSGFLNFMDSFGETVTDDNGNIIDCCEGLFLNRLEDYVNSDQIIRDHLKFGIDVINRMDHIIGIK